MGNSILFSCTHTAYLVIIPLEFFLIGFLLSSFSACPVCYIPVEQAIASMPISPSKSPILRSLTYVHDKISIQSEGHDGSDFGGSDFGGFPSLEERDAAFDIRETMTVHCGLVHFC